MNTNKTYEKIKTKGGTVTLQIDAETDTAITGTPVNKLMEECKPRKVVGMMIEKTIEAPGFNGDTYTYRTRTVIIQKSTIIKRTELIENLKYGELEPSK